MTRGPQAAATVMFIVLFGASAAVAALVLRARGPDVVLEVTRMPRHITPDGDGVHDVAHIEFFVRETDPHARIELVGRNLKLTRTLADDRALQADQPVKFVWNGRTNSGSVARPGNYRLRVVLPDHDRDIVVTRQLALRR